MWACAAIGLFALGLWGVVSGRVQHCQKFDAEGLNLGRGVVHLIYSMERKCVLCYKEVNKLLTLKSRMAKFGREMEVSVGMNKPPAPNQRRKLPPELIVEVTHIWRKLGKKNGHIFIFDKCGKLAYQVITPWSKQIYPFTGMAALSAISDDPCGECNVTSQTNANPLSENAIHPVRGGQHNKSSGEADQDHGKKQLKDSKISLAITLRSRHNHVEDRQTISNIVVELRSNDPKNNGHAETSDVNQYNIPTAGTNSNNATENLAGPKVTDTPTRETTTVPSTEYYDDYSDDVESSSSESQGDQHETQELMKHYRPIMKWMSCVQQILGT